MIMVFATMKIKPGKADQFIQEFRKAQPKVLKDPGAVQYSLHRDISDANKFYFYERYEDQKAVDYHSTTPHFKAFFKAIGPLLEGEPEISLCQEV